MECWTPKYCQKSMPKVVIYHLAFLMPFGIYERNDQINGMRESYTSGNGIEAAYFYITGHVSIIK